MCVCFIGCVFKCSWYINNINVSISTFFSNFVSILGTMNSDRHQEAQKYQSRTQRRKQAKQKEENLQKVLTKTPKLESYFSVFTSQQPDENVPADTSCGGQSSQDLNVTDSMNMTVISPNRPTSSSVVEANNFLNVTTDDNMGLMETSEPEETRS